MKTQAFGKAPRPVLSRPWRIVVQELSQETNPKRVLELAEELNRAFGEEKYEIPASLQNGDASQT
ncbi:MAG TPA: hypothetical protein VJT08_22070 [Terriglobales bacterium]|nr:hypothetical protein [Terriglobales bacterium]